MGISRFNWNTGQKKFFDLLMLPGDLIIMRGRMDDFEQEMKTCFLDEASQLLEDAEQNFMVLEASKDDLTVVENLFRLAHNLKGGARAVGFAEMAEFTHVLESLLLKLKNKELGATTNTVSLLLACNDHLRNSISSLRSDFSFKMESSELLARLQAQISGEVEEASTPEVDQDVQSLLEAASQFAEDAMAESLTEPFAGSFGETVPEPTFVEETVASETPVVSVPISPAKTAAPVAEAPSASAAATKKTGAAEDESIRVSLKRLEALIDNVGELVILQTVLNQQKSQISSPLIHRTIGQLGKITKDIQEISMSLRMVPLKQTFQKMQRIVRDTANALGKDIQFVMEGEHTEIDKTVVDHLGDPLVHLVRNAVDHGIDGVEDRERLNKPKAGLITLGAFHRGGQIVIEVRDDGKGLDGEKLRSKAIEKGILRPDQKLSPQECQALIFAAGFSTKEQVTEVSGRGVGMDVVKTNIEKRLSGEIELESEIGKGTCVRIKLPLTLAIIEGMVVQSTNDRFVIPLGQVFESLQPQKEDVNLVSGLGEVLTLRGEHLPLYRLSKLITNKADTRDATSGIAIVVRSGDKPFCILVDDIFGQQQIVIKQLGNEIRDIEGVTGGAILGDGRPALILDLVELVSNRISGTKRRVVA